MTIIGVILPLLILLVSQLLARKEDTHWANIEELRAREMVAVESRSTAEADHSPGRIIGWSMIGLGGAMACLIPINPGDRVVILVFAVILAAIGTAMLRRLKSKSQSNSP
jgi:hypothetical protein